MDGLFLLHLYEVRMQLSLSYSTVECRSAEFVVEIKLAGNSRLLLCIVAITVILLDKHSAAGFLDVKKLSKVLL